MLDFVVWAFAIALFPLVLALAWSLIVTVGKWIGLGLSQVLGDAEPRRHAHPLSFDTPSGSPSSDATASRTADNTAPGPKERRLPDKLRWFVPEPSS